MSTGQTTSRPLSRSEAMPAPRLLLVLGTAVAALLHGCGGGGESATQQSAADALTGKLLGGTTAQWAALRAPYWPAIAGAPVVQEWYSDLPWHQKLGTYAGNEIDQALILPYDALGDAEKGLCRTLNLQEPACMLELGVNNVLGMLRTDTQYAANDPKIQAATECRDPSLPCIEVRLTLASFWTRSTGSEAALLPRPFGTEPPDANNYYGGYTITDGSSYAPQMPWYMAHYCDSPFPKNTDVQDPVCYADYFSPMNDGFNAVGLGATDWPRSVPWSVYPATPINHCTGGNGETTCTMALAGFDLREVPPAAADLQYAKYNANLLTWFNGAVQAFATDFSAAELQRHFPWSGIPVTWESFLYPQAVANPFLGQFDHMVTAPAYESDCDVGVNGPTGKGVCQNTAIVRASSHLYPRQCTLGDLTSGNAARLRQCGLNYELHHNGYLEQWPATFWPDVNAAGMIANQYGRTSFLFAGIPGMQMPVSFWKPTGSDVSVYDQVYNSSIFSLYLPIANAGDVKRALIGRNYTDTEFFRTLLMSNHMESDPLEFAQGIRGKVLWHNEYRTQKMYEADANGASSRFSAKTFAAAFPAQAASAPFHNNTCDGCHVRNGSGVPINPAGTLDAALQEFMTAAPYSPYPVKDYTFTGQIRPMKLVFFDLAPSTARLDASRYSEPLSFPALLRLSPPRNVSAAALYYSNKVMNYFGDSFHTTTPGNTFTWNYVPAEPSRLVVGTARVNAELGKTYQPMQVAVGSFQTAASCQLMPQPPGVSAWPTSCADVSGAAIGAAIANAQVGAMLLNGKRLGNLGAIESIPNQAIIAWRAAQSSLLGAVVAGEIIWNAGARDGVDGMVKKTCATRSLADCFIGRFGWLGDRTSLEDQIANAAFVEMNMLSPEGYQKLYGNSKVLFPIRYAYPNCGPANKSCVESAGNGKLTEADINRMAAYARWVGSPTRSEFQVSLPEVAAGEALFKQLNCDTCHVIARTPIVPDNTMLTKVFRDRLAARVTPYPSASPFLSYIGTDLLMHDMGYLSQVGTASQTIRDANGVVLPEFVHYVQKTRTPPLKGLGLNRYATGSHNNTKAPGDPACDFLLHDGRACDAVEAAFLHDGPAVKKLGTIDKLNTLTAQQLRQLRAFLYSL